jgi:hypothetical protein
MTVVLWADPGGGGVMVNDITEVLAVVVVDITEVGSVVV